MTSPKPVTAQELEDIWHDAQKWGALPTPRVQRLYDHIAQLRDELYRLRREHVQHEGDKS